MYDECYSKSVSCMHRHDGNSVLVDAVTTILSTDSSFRDVSALSGINLATSVPVGIPLFKRSTATPTSSVSHSFLCCVYNLQDLFLRLIMKLVMLAIQFDDWH